MFKSHDWNGLRLKISDAILITKIINLNFIVSRAEQEIPIYASNICLLNKIPWNLYLTEKLEVFN